MQRGAPVGNAQPIVVVDDLDERGHPGQELRDCTGHLDLAAADAVVGHHVAWAQAVDFARHGNAHHETVQCGVPRTGVDGLGEIPLLGPQPGVDAVTHPQVLGPCGEKTDGVVVETEAPAHGIELGDVDHFGRRAPAGQQPQHGPECLDHRVLH